MLLCPTSFPKVVSFEIDFIDLSGKTRRLSLPDAKAFNLFPEEPNFLTKSFSSHRFRSLRFLIPIAASFSLVPAPTPHKIFTGLVDRNFSVSNLPIMENPLGLSRSEATFAKNLLCESPTDPVNPSSFFSLLVSSASKTAGGFL